MGYAASPPLGDVEIAGEERHELRLQEKTGWEGKQQVEL
jgi:hypothetical protein